MLLRAFQQSRFVSAFPGITACSMGLALLVVGPAAAQSDILVLNNGDRMTGEIKKLVGGDLHFEPDYAENIFIIDWAAVERIETEETFVVETSAGQRLSGTFQTAADISANIVVQEEAGETMVEQAEVVALRSYDTSFWGRVGASVSLGASLTKANSTKTGNFVGSLSYATARWDLRSVLDASNTTVGAIDPARRWDWSVDYRRFVGGNYFVSVGSSFFHSDEQQLALRSQLSPGFGLFLKRTNRLHLAVSGGAQWVNESFQDPDLESVNGAEGWAGVEYNAFDIGDLSFLFQLNASPSFSELGRIRLDGVTELKWELPKDLYINLRMTDNFDSRPLNEGPRNDYVFTTGIGWEL